MTVVNRTVALNEVDTKAVIEGVGTGEDVSLLVASFIDHNPTQKGILRQSSFVSDALSVILVIAQTEGARSIHHWGFRNDIFGQA